MAEEQTPPEGGQQIESQRPDWLPEQFESPEALVKSYEESRAEMSRAQNELQRERQQFTEALQRLEAQPPAQQPFNPAADPLVQLAQRAYDEGDMATFLAVNAQISQAAIVPLLDERLGSIKEQIGAGSAHDRELALRMAEEKVAPMYGDRWETEIAPALNERMHLLPAQPSVEGYTRFLTEQAQIIDYPKLQARMESATAERDAKLAAQTLAGGTARVPLQAPKSEEWDRVKSANVGGFSKLVNG